MNISFLSHLKIHIHIVKEFIIDSSKFRMVFLPVCLQVKIFSLQVSNPVAPRTKFSFMPMMPSEENISDILTKGAKPNKLSPGSTW